jgi:hypothetical protein
MSGGRDLFAKCFAVALIMCAIGSIRCLELDSAGAAESRVGSILSRVEQASLTGSAGFQALETDGWGFETYVGYGSLLSISTEASWENEAPGLFELAGWAVYSDVVAISCREDLGEERMTRLPSEPDGWFSGTVWFVDGPGRYSLSVATRPPGKSSYIVVCSFCVRNVSCEIPLVPVEYVGYGYDLTIDFPRQESNTVTDVLHVRGWSRYGRVRATVQVAEEEEEEELEDVWSAFELEDEAEEEEAEEEDDWSWGWGDDDDDDWGWGSWWDDDDDTSAATTSSALEMTYEFSKDSVIEDIIDGEQVLPHKFIKMQVLKAPIKKGTKWTYQTPDWTEVDAEIIEVGKDDEKLDYVKVQYTAELYEGPYTETRVYKKGLGLVEFEAINPDGTEFTYSVST